MSVKVVCAILVVLPTIAVCLNRGSSCTTPNGESAKCTGFSVCKVIKDAVATQNRDAIKFAQASQCGYDSEPLVCCGTSAVTIEKTSSCTTPNGETATCKKLSSCKVIVDAVATRNKDAIDFARKSQCGYTTEPMVCCGSLGFPEKSLSPLLPNKTVCGFAKAFRVFGGEETELWEHPWVVLLRYKNIDGTDAGFQCGGTLINNRYVLTAAHCVIIGSNQGFDLDSVRLGEWRISTDRDCEKDLANEECSDPVVDLKIEDKIVNRQYVRRTGQNDIALLRLQRNVKFTNYIRPICLPQPNSPLPPPGTEMIVVGWGATENSSNSDVKLKVKVPIVSLPDCTAKLGNQRRPVNDDQLCAGGVSGKDSCRGDSGGPLMGSYAKLPGDKDQFYQEGVVSWGVGCAVAGYPAIYTRVPRYMDWIVQSLKE